MSFAQIDGVIKMRGIVGFLLAMSIASPAVAKPVYLTCDIKNSKETFIIEVTMDEDNQQVTINIPITGNLVRRPAQFKADHVIVPDGEMMSYDFNRIDGTVIRRMPILDNAVADSGKCKVSKVIERAF